MSLSQYTLVAVLAMLFSRALVNRWVNPLALFTLIWLSISLLYQLRLSEHQVELESQTYFVLVASLIAFAIMFAAGWYFRVKRRQLPAYCGRSYMPLFWTWFAASVFEVFYCGGMPAFWIAAKSGKTYVDFGIPTLHGFLCALGLAVATLSFYELAAKHKKIMSGGFAPDEKKHLIVLVTIALYYVLAVSRQMIVSIVIQCAVVLLLAKDGKNKGIGYIALAAPIVLVACIIGFGLAGNFRTGYNSFLAVSKLDSSLPPVLSGFYWVYMYLTMTLANVNNLIVSGFDHVGLVSVIGRSLPSAVRTALGLSFNSHNYLVSPNYTVSGFFASWYDGAGLQGVLVISGVYGLLGGVTCRRFERMGDARSTLMYCVAIEIIALSFFANMLFYLPNVFQLAVFAWHFRHSDSKSSVFRRKIASGPSRQSALVSDVCHAAGMRVLVLGE